VPTDSQTYRLPRLIPLSFSIHYLGHHLFGRDEFGSRVIIALLGTLQVVLAFLLLDRPLGRVTALATALLLAVWPEHLYRSQEDRFYMVATVCATLCMGMGAQAICRRSAWWAAGACVAALAAVLAHTVQGVLIGGLFAGILAAAWLGRDRALGWRLLPVVAGGGLIAAVLFIGHVLPLARGWNSSESWGFSLSHAVMASVSQLGWPVALLALVGAVSLWKRGSAQDGYWLAWAVIWGIGTLLLPFAVTYHPGYVFPLALGAIVLAAQAVAQIYEALHAHHAPAAYAWLGAATIFNLPSLVSHYQDGSRFDFRAPAQHVSKNWQPGDRVASASPRLLKHYAAEGIDPIGLKGTDPVPRLEKLAREQGRLWIVFPSPRGGMPESLQKWLGKHCQKRLIVCKKRFDYYENVTEVYLFEPREAGPMWADGR